MAAPFVRAPAVHIKHMTIGSENPSTHPQTAVFLRGAEILKAERYWSPSEIVEERVEFLRALAAVTTEVAFHLNRHDILDPAGVEAYRRAAGVETSAFIPSSAEMILLGALQHAIDRLRSAGE